MADKKRQDVTIGTVTETFPNALFRVRITENGDEKVILTYLSGKMRLNRIKVIIGDAVEVVLDPYGGKGRIVRRLDNKNTAVS
jgi:translation initiation factor IF-1